jgi:hypothetical protein
VVLSAQQRQKQRRMVADSDSEVDEDLECAADGEWGCFFSLGRVLLSRAVSNLAILTPACPQECLLPCPASAAGAILDGWGSIQRHLA